MRIRTSIGKRLHGLIGLALALTIGLHPETHAGQEPTSPHERAHCSGHYAPGIVLVGGRSSASDAEPFSISEVEQHLLSPRTPPGLREHLDAPREILSHQTGAVYALRVPIGQEYAALQALRRNPDVAFAELDYAVHATGVITPNDPGWAQQWGPAKIEAPTAWSVTTGAPDVIVALVDTGIQLDHEDLADNVWTNPGEIPNNGLDDDGNGKPDDLHGWHFYDGGTYAPQEDGNVADDHGHGTHVAGIAGARINNSLGVAGIAGGSRLMPVKVLDASGDGWYSDLAQGIIYAVDNGARIINLSVGGEPPSQTLQRAVDYAHARGALTVAAAGNEDVSVLYPGACDRVLAVSATDPDDHVWPDSCQGPEVDVAAPGTHIYSTGLSGRYHYLYGTSMATPHVAGLATLIWSARSDLTNVQVAEVITATAVDVNEHAQPGWDAYAGWGRIEASSAISAAQRLPLNEYSVEMTPSRVTVTATLGSLTTHTLAVRNVGNARDAYLVELDGNAWETTAATDLIGPIDSDTADTLDISVAIPMTAGHAVTDTLHVTVTSVGDPTKSAISTLTTTATGETWVSSQ